MYEPNRLSEQHRSKWSPDSIVIDQIADFLPARHFESVLDYGAGNSPYRTYISCERYAKADITQNVAGDIDHLICPGESLGVADGSFDLILLLDVLEHVPDPSFVLHELRRLLRPEGTLIVSVPFLYREHETPNDYCRLTMFGAEKLVRECGGRVVKMEKAGNASYTLFTLFLERAILNGERSVLGPGGKLLNRLARYVFPLIRPILATRPPIDAGCYHHLLLEIGFDGGRCGQAPLVRAAGK